MVDNPVLIAVLGVLAVATICLLRARRLRRVAGDTEALSFFEWVILAVARAAMLMGGKERE